MCDTNPFTAQFSFHSPKDDRLFKKDDRVLSQTRPRFLKRRSFLSYKLFVVIYTKECINLQIKKVHCIRHIIGTPTDWFSAWSDDGVKVTIGYFRFVATCILLDSYNKLRFRFDKTDRIPWFLLPFSFHLQLSQRLIDKL